MHVPQVVRRLALLLLAGVVASTASAAPLSVTLRSHRTSGDGPDAFVLQIRSSAGADVRTERISTTSPISVNVQQGLYELRLVDAAGFWSAPVTAFVGEQGATAEVSVYEVTTLEGRFTSGRQPTTPPSQLSARFRSVKDDTTGDLINGETSCRVNQLKWACDVPSARLDVAIKTPGHVSRYWWNVGAKGKRLSLGALDLRPGASLVGQIQLPVEYNRRNAEVLVRLTPVRHARSSNSAEDDRIASTVSPTTKPNARGFFVFEGVAPGGYVLDAVLDKLTARKINVRIIESVETELREALILDLPSAINVAVLPARDPWKRPWVVSLKRRSSIPSIVHTERQGHADGDGSWSAQDLPSGDYILDVLTENQDRWATREFSVPLADTLTIDVPRLRVRGKVTIGDKPLRAEVTLVDDNGVSIRTVSDSNGRFGAYYPAGDERIAEVSVIANDPPVAATIDDVRMQVSESGDRSLNISLPDTTIVGDVVDDQGKPVSTAVVNANHDRGITIPEIGVDGNGSFSVRGLPPGNLRLRARGDQGRFSEVVHVQLTEDPRNPVAVRLILKQSRILSGQVVAPSGPVPGAIVHAFPRPGGAFFSPNTTTDANGQYSVQLPSGTLEADVFVDAPGFATRMFRQRVRDERLDVPVAQVFGTLVVEIKYEQGDRRDFAPTLAHLGAAFRLGIFRNVRVEADGSRWRATVLELEPGDYVVCDDNARPSCVQVTVAPFGAVTASLSRIK